MKSKEETINLDVFRSELIFNSNDFSFTWKFYGRRGGVDGKKLVVVMRMRLWWIRWIRKELRGVIANARTKITEYDQGPVE